MRTALYTRISKDKTGEEAGVERQLEKCTALAQALDGTVVDTFCDNDISAFNGAPRPRCEALLAAMGRGEFDAVICWHVDRLYRSTKDLDRIIDAAEKWPLYIRTVTSGDLDLSTSAGRMNARILASVARQESEHHGERRKEANQARAAKGQWCSTGHRPFGYDKTGAPLEPEASMLRQAAADVLAGRSLHAIARQWNDEGHTTTKGAAWTNLHVRRVLTNPRIAALRVHQGEVIGAGAWEPIIDQTTWDGMVAVLSDAKRRNGLAFERRYLLSGIARCGVCGGRLYGGFPHGKDKPMMYTCRPKAHVGRLGDALDDRVSREVLERLMEPDAHLLLDNPADVDVPELRTRRAALVASKDQLGTLFGRGVIDAVQLENGSVELKAQISAIDRQLADAASTSPVAALLATGDQLHKRWLAMTPAQRGQIINELVVVTVHPRTAPEPVTVEFRGAKR